MPAGHMQTISMMARFILGRSERIPSCRVSRFLERHMAVGGLGSASMRRDLRLGFRQYSSGFMAMTDFPWRRG